MAYTSATLFRMTGGDKIHGPSLWLYSTSDDVRVVGNQVDYFSNGAARGMHVGDVVMTTNPSQVAMGIGLVSGTNGAAATVSGRL